MTEPSPVANRHPVVLSGYYGFDNAGDDAILQATVAGFRDNVPHSTLTVLSSNPTATASDCGVQAVHRYDWREIWPVLSRAGLFLSGGGGLFQDVTSRRSLVYYLTMLRIARARGMKTMVYAQGLGPLRRRSSVVAVRNVLRHVDCITLRDQASADLLSAIGLPGRAEVTADPAFALAPASPERARELLRDEGCPLDRPLLAVALRSWSAFSEGGRIVLADALDTAAGLGAQPVFVNMHRHDDYGAAKEVAGLMKTGSTLLQGSYSPSDLAGVIGQCQALVAMRLHALILGALSGVPAVALTYDPKVDAAARQLGITNILDIRDLEEMSLGPAVEAALASDAGERERIRSAALVQRSRAGRNFDLAKQLLTQP